MQPHAPLAVVLNMLSAANTLGCFQSQFVEHSAAKYSSTFSRNSSPTIVAKLLAHESIAQLQPRELGMAGLLHPDVFFTVR